MNILDSGRISEGKTVAAFERKFSKIIGTKYCVLVNSGTSALIAGLLALIYDERYPKVKKGAKVITTPTTYIATSNAIKLVGLEPVFVDVNLETFDVIPEQIEKILENSNSDDYCMILPVHLMGYPANMDKINEIANKYDLITFEDTAQAHGSKYNGKNTGTLSLLADYSFYIAHNIQVGEMGAIVTDDEKIYKNIKKIKANGRVCDCVVCTRSKGICPKSHLERDPRFLHEFIGYNFKTMEFQAALGLIQLNRFDEIIEKRQSNVQFLNKKLSKFSDRIILPKFSKDYSYLAYPIIILPDSEINREVIRTRLLENGVESRPLFFSIPTQQPSFQSYKTLYKDKLPNADYIGDNAFYIGCHQYLSDEDLNKIIEAFEKALV
jgi:CDP-4-dehydro-6-deoxyglucose reductase, E1